MKPHYLIVISALILSIIGGLAWAAFHYSENAQEEKQRADVAEQKADAAETVTANVLRTVSVMNEITRANHDAKNQIALDAQRASNDITTAVAKDDCASRSMPAGAVERLREYADSLRTGSGTTTPGIINY